GEHAVAQEGQPLVGLRAPAGPRGMGEHGRRELVGQLVEQLPEERGGVTQAWKSVRGHSASWPALAGAEAGASPPRTLSTKSTAWPTVRTWAACSSGMRTR